MTGKKNGTRKNAEDAERRIGPDPIPRARLTAERLAQAIRRAVSDPGMRERAGAMGEKLRAEDGVGKAVRIVEQFL